MDLMGPLPESLSHNRYLLAALDDNSGTMAVVAVKRKSNVAAEAIELLEVMQHRIAAAASKHFAPTTVVSSCQASCCCI